MMVGLIGIIVLQGGAGVLRLLRQLRPRAAAVDAGHRRASRTSWSSNIWLILWRSPAVVGRGAGARGCRQPGQRARLDRLLLELPWVGDDGAQVRARRSWRGRWRRCSAAASRSSTRSRSACRSMTNRYLARELDDVAAPGAGRAELRRPRCWRAACFPDVAVKMVEVGESTGALQEMLNSLADFYDEEIETEVGAIHHADRAGAAGRHGRRDRGGGAGALHAAVRAELGGWSGLTGVGSTSGRSSRHGYGRSDEPRYDAGRLRRGSRATRASWPSATASSSSTWTSSGSTRSCSGRSRPT